MDVIGNISTFPFKCIQELAFQMLKLRRFLYLRREQYQKLICGKIWGTAAIYSLMMEMRTSLPSFTFYIYGCSFKLNMKRTTTVLWCLVYFLTNSPTNAIVFLILFRSKINSNFLLIIHCFPLIFFVDFRPSIRITNQGWKLFIKV